jgi:stress response protein YsnF
MLREERVHVESRIRPRERIVVRKHVITEHVRVMVPVRREELIVERVPLDAPSDPGAELDLTLMEDEPVVHTRTERFRANITPTNEETAR